MASSGATPSRDRPILDPLEPRIMLDGAGPTAVYVAGLGTGWLGQATLAASVRLAAVPSAGPTAAVARVAADVLASAGQHPKLRLAPSGTDFWGYKAPNYLVGDRPIDIAVADFNRDGLLDVATSNQLDDTVTVLYGQSDGGFAGREDYPAGGCPVAVAARDFNADGLPDMAVVKAYSDEVYLLYGQAGGGFIDGGTYLGAVGVGGVVSTDLNADDLPDLAITDAASDEVVVLYGQTGGGLGGQERYGVGHEPAGIVAGDFNADGLPDLVAANHGWIGLSMLYGQAGGGFQRGDDYNVGWRPGAMTAEDLNADGVLDLALTRRPEGDVMVVTVLYGQPEGGLGGQLDYEMQGRPGVILAEDYNGDARPDLVFNNGSGLSVLYAQSGGGFGEREDCEMDARALAKGDFNSDGLPDLAVTVDDNAVTLLLCRPGGGLPLRPEIPVGDYPNCLATGDFNGDSLPDLAVTNYFSHDVSVLYGQVGGGLGDREDYTAGQNPLGITTADFDGDGRADLAVTNRGEDNASVLYGQADGGFGGREDYGVGDYPGGIAAADFNSDSRLDLAVANTLSHSVSILYGQDGGGFGGRQDYGEFRYPRGLTAADLDADGIVDLAVANEGPDTVSVLYGQAEGGFADQVDHVVRADPRGIVTGDLNGDGRLDLVVACWDTQHAPAVNVLYAEPEGGFRFRTLYRVAELPAEVLTADFNGDGHLDIAASCPRAGVVTVLLGRGDETFGERADLVMGAPLGIAAADFNGDGRLELAAANGTDDAVGLLYARAAGGFCAREQVGVKEYLWPIVAADFDGDGQADVATGSYRYGMVGVLSGHTGAGFARRGVYALTLGQSRGMTTGDFNGDGLTDLVLSNGVFDYVIVAYGDGNGGFAGREDIAVAGGPLGVRAADFDGDGLLDVVVARSADDNLSVLYGQPGGGLAGRIDYAVGQGPWGIATGDFNGDGLPDLAVTNVDDDSVTVLYSQADGGLGGREDCVVGNWPRGILAADLDADGLTDLAVVNRVDDDVTILYGQGGGGFADRRDYAVGSGPWDIAAADFDGDGWLDLAVTNEEDHDISVLYGGVGRRFGRRADYLVGDTPRGIATGDFDGDGQPDLAVANCLSGDVSILYHMGARVAGSVWHDADGDGVWDAGEVPLIGWTAYRDKDQDGLLGDGDHPELTDADGRYEIDRVPYGTNLFRLDTPEDIWAVRQPTDGFHSVEAFPGGAYDGYAFGVAIKGDCNGDGAVDFVDLGRLAGNYGSDGMTWVGGDFTGDGTVDEVDLGILASYYGRAVMAEASGIVWHDVNSDGLPDEGEPPLEGWRVFVDADGDGQWDEPEELACLTDAHGRYAFELPPASYSIALERPTGWLHTFPAEGSHEVNLAPGSLQSGLDFGNWPPPATISGTKWEDLDGDGGRDPDESGLPGVRIYLDLDGSGTHDADEPTRITDAEGGYVFYDLLPGTYVVTEVLPANWEQTHPAEGTYTVTVEPAEVVSGLDFGNYPLPASVAGLLWHDENDNGVRDDGEPPLIGWTVYVDMDDDGEPDVGEPSAGTGADGDYVIEGVRWGTRTVRQVLPALWRCTYPAGGEYEVQLQPGEERTGLDFANYQIPALIEGLKWNDLDADGLRDDAEPPLAGWTIYLDVDGDGALGAAEPWTVTAADGSYRFEVEPGSYVVREQPQEDWGQTFPAGSAGHEVTLAFGESAGDLDFGNYCPVAWVSGTKWDDRDGNGVRDEGEGGVESWRIYADLNANGQLDGGEPVAVTGPDGAYTLVVEPGEHLVREEPQAGWTQTFPADGAGHTVSLINGQTATGIDFGNDPAPGRIEGHVWHDSDSDGRWDNDEEPLPGWTIYLDLDQDGCRDPAEPAQVTAADGFYAFDVEHGTYTVREVLPDPSWIETFPGDGHVVVVEPGQTVTDANFGNRMRSCHFEGHQWYDADADGQWDDTEPPLVGWKIYADADGNGQWDPDEPYAITDQAGYWRLDVVAGDYVITEVLPDGWLATCPGGFYTTDNSVRPARTHILDATGASEPVGSAGFTVRPNGLVWDPGAPGLFSSSVHSGTAVELAELNLTTGAAALIGPHNVSYVEALVEWDGTLYAFEAVAGLGTVDRTTGAFTPLHSLPVAVIGADADDAAGIVYGLGEDNNLYTVDLETGAMSLIGPTGVDFQYDAGLAWNPANGKLYALGNDQSARGDTLFILDIATGAATAVGQSLPGRISSLEYVPRGWLGGAGRYRRTIEWDQTIGSLNFGGSGPCEAAGAGGTVWHDADADGARGPDEAGLTGWTVFADLDSDGELDDGEPATVSTSDGEWYLSLAPGSYTIAQQVLPDWEQTYPAGGTHTVVVEAGLRTPGIDFGNVPLPGVIEGRVWYDELADGVWGGGESALEGYKAYVDLDESGYWEVGEPFDITDATGAYGFAVTPGAHVVALHFGDEPVRWRLSPPGGRQSVSVAAGQTVTDVNFGCILLGDATGDGVVDYVDLGIFATNYGRDGMTWTDGDFTGNGLVDVNDLGCLATNYDRSVAWQSVKEGRSM